MMAVLAWKIVGAVVLLIIIWEIVVNIPELRRYLRMRKM
jgi:hypothetical protein